MLDTVKTLQELARHPLSPETFSVVVKALLKADAETAPQGSSPGLPAAANDAPVQEVLLRDIQRVTVSDAEGHRSTVSVPGVLFDAVVERMGSLKAATRLVRTLHRETPPGARNKSGWVQDKLQERLRNTAPRNQA